jgi:F0F1-type ATP synthase membrane subunit b/b'
LVIYFIRRSKSHEAELKEFLRLAQHQLETHKKEASTDANQKVAQAMALVKQVQAASQAFEEQAQKEYQEIIEDAKNERRELLAQAKAEIEELYHKADQELAIYQAERHEEIEKNLVKLVIAVSEKVAEIKLTPKEHEDIINKALEDVKLKKSRGA